MSLFRVLFVAGMVVIAWPLLTGSGKEKTASISDRTQAYTTAKNLLVNGADALERIMSSYKEVKYCCVVLLPCRT